MEVERHGTGRDEARRGRSCGKQNAEKLLNFARWTLNIPFYWKLGNYTRNLQALIYLLLFVGRGRGCREIKITCSSIRSLKRFYTIVYGNVYEYLLFSFGKSSMTMLTILEFFLFLLKKTRREFSWGSLNTFDARRCFIFSFIVSRCIYIYNLFDRAKDWWIASSNNGRLMNGKFDFGGLSII